MDLNSVASYNGVSKMNKSGKPYTNMEIMVMFLYKINDKYNSSRLLSSTLSDMTKKIFDETYATKDDFFKIALERIGERPFNEIRNYIIQQKNTKDIKKVQLKFYEKFVNMNNFKYDTIDGLNKVLVLIAALPFYLERNKKTRLDKFKYLAELLYQRNNKYLDLAGETIINNNKEIKLNEIIFGINIELLTNIEKFTNYCSNNKLQINIALLLLFVLVFLLLKKNDL